MRLALVTDAWAPQVNGVVRTLQRTTAELDQVIGWLTGFGARELRRHLDQETTFEDQVGGSDERIDALGRWGQDTSPASAWVPEIGGRR